MTPWQTDFRQSGTTKSHRDLRNDLYLSNKSKLSSAGSFPEPKRSSGRWAFKIITNAQYNLFFRVTFLFYFLLVHPFVTMLLRADCKRKHLYGFGLLVVANEKSENLGTDLLTEEIG